MVVCKGMVTSHQRLGSLATDVRFSQRRQLEVPDRGAGMVGTWGWPSSCLVDACLLAVS